MRGSIVMMLCAGCGVLGGGKSMEGTWEGQCDAEDDDGNDYNYNIELDLTDVEKGEAEGDGVFDSSIVLTFVTTTNYTYTFQDELALEGEGDIRAELSDDEWTIEGNDWELKLDGDSLDDLDTADWELVGTKDGDQFTGDIELDLAGAVTVRGTCELDQT